MRLPAALRKLLKRPALDQLSDAVRQPDTRPFARTGEGKYVPSMAQWRRDGRGHVRVLAHRYDEVQLRDYDRVRMYPAVRDCVWMLRTPVARANFHFACADSQIADLAAQVLAPKIRELLYDLINGGLQFGFQVVEKVWAPVFDVTLTSGQSGTGNESTRFPFVWGIDRFAAMAPNDLVLLVDARTGRFGGVRQYVMAEASRQEIGAEKLILFTHDPEFDTMYGVPRTKAAVPFVELAQSIYDDMAVFSRTFAVPWIIGRHRPGFTAIASEGEPDKVDNAELMNSLLGSLESGHTVSLPSEFDAKTGAPLWDVTITQPPPEDRYVPKLEHVNQMIRMAMVVPEMASSSTPDTGTYNLGEAILDQFVENVETYLDQLTVVINEQLLRDFVIYNFGASAPALTIVFEPLDAKVRRALLSALVSMLAQGAPVTDGQGNELVVDWGRVGEDNGLPLQASSALSRARALVAAAQERLGSSEIPKGSEAELSEIRLQQDARGNEHEEAGSPKGGQFISKGKRVSYEATPGVSTPVLPGIHNATYEQKSDYTEAQLAVIVDSRLHELFGLPEPVISRGPGWYEGESNPSIQVTFRSGSRTALLAYGSALGKALHQEGVGMHDFRPAKSVDEANIAALRFEHDVDEEDVRAMAEALANDNLFLVSEGKEMRVINGAGLPNAEFHAKVNAAADAANLDFGAHGYLAGDTPYVSSEDYNRRLDEYEQKHQSKQGKARAATAATSSGRSDFRSALRDLYDRTKAVRVEYAQKYEWNDPELESTIDAKERRRRAEELVRLRERGELLGDEPGRAEKAKGLPFAAPGSPDAGGEQV